MINDTNLSPNDITDGKKSIVTIKERIKPALTTRETTLLHTLDVARQGVREYLVGEDKTGKIIVGTTRNETEGGYYPLPLTKREKLDLLVRKTDLIARIAFTTGNDLKSPPYKAQFNLYYPELCKALGIENTKPARKRIRDAFLDASHLEYTFVPTRKDLPKYPAAHMFDTGFKGGGNGYIQITFTLIAIEALTHERHLAFFDIQTLKLNNVNAYNMAMAIQEHYSQTKNHMRKTANRLKVSTLLERCYYPDIKSIRESRHSWIDKIKDQFENALGEIRDIGIIEKYSYDISSDNDFSCYEKWADTTIIFELKNPPDRKQAVDNMRKRIAAAKRKKNKKAAK